MPSLAVTFKHSDDNKCNGTTTPRNKLCFTGCEFYVGYADSPS